MTKQDEKPFLASVHNIEPVRAMVKDLQRALTRINNRDLARFPGGRRLRNEVAYLIGQTDAFRFSVDKCLVDAERVELRWAGATQ